MAFDGSGVFLRLRNWVADATAGVKIRADFHDTEDDNFAAGLSNCIAKDGQSTITQNIKFNSKRITALADPVDPQDASTKAYADTKASLAGGSTFTSDVVLKEATPSLTLDATPGNSNTIYGQKSDKNRWAIVLGNSVAESGGNAGSDFNLVNYADDGSSIGTVLGGFRSTGLLVVKGDPTVPGGIATKQYVDTAAASKLSSAGGTITGNLQVNGTLNVIGSNAVIFGAAGGPGYIQWNGGGNYALGGGGTIWHSGNFNPSTAITNIKLVFALDSVPPVNDLTDRYPGAVASNATYWSATAGVAVRLRYLQVFTNSWWTVSYA